jgi:carboxyl-terminal processing protease
MKKLQIWWPLLFAITLIAGMWFGYKLSNNIPQGKDFFSRNKKSSLQEVVDLLNNQYVDSIHVDSLNQDAIYAMLEKLDPHTVYIPMDYTMEANEDLQGNFQGIGVEYMILNDTVHVVNVLKDGPSEKAGLQTGDRFLKVGDSVVAGNNISNDRIKKLLRGPENTQVSVSLLRGNATSKINITRGTIPKPAVDAAYMMNDTTAFIHINKFSRSTYEEFMAAMEDLQRKGMKKLLLDLRDNGGGILDEAVDIADEFLDGEKLVLYTQGLHNSKREYICKRPGLFEKGELVVLINEFSASASEVLAGALQDWDRATIVGRRSFGKGLVQEPFELSDGSQIRLTVSRYYTPSGRNIQKPFNKNHGAYEEEVFTRHSEVDSPQAESNSKTYRTLLKKKPVFGGGGISPDHAIPMDSGRISAPLRELFHQQVLSEFVYREYVLYKEYFKSFKTPAAFNAGFKIEGGPFNLFKDLVATFGNKVEGLNQLPSKDQEYLGLQFKKLMAQQLYKTEGYYEVSNSVDPTVLKALQVK